MKLDRVDFELVDALARSQSMADAAIFLNISAAAVSQKLIRLELIIGQKILHRTGKFHLTVAGDRIAKHGAVALAGMMRLSAELADLRDSPTYPLTIMTNQSVIVDDLPDVIELFCEKFPLIKVNLLEGNMLATVQGLRDGTLDAGILYNHLPVIGLNVEPYRTDTLCLIVPISHQLASHETITFAEAANHKFIGAGLSHNITNIMRNEAYRANLQLSFAMHVSSYEVQAHLVSSTDIGIALVLGNVARRFKTFRPIKAIPLSDSWAFGEYQIVTRLHDIKTPHIGAFRNALIMRHAPPLHQYKINKAP